jgi:hypothetical protein
MKRQAEPLQRADQGPGAGGKPADRYRLAPAAGPEVRWPALPAATGRVK